MKTILRIITILLVAAVVAAGFIIAVNNTSDSASTTGVGSPHASTDANGQTFQPMERPEGGNGQGGSIAGVLVTLAKLTGIALAVVLIQKAFNILGNRKLIPTQR